MPKICRELLRFTALGSAALGSMWQVALADPVKTYSWSGYYVGGFLGSARDHSPLLFNTPDLTGFNTSFQSNTPRDFNTPYATIPNDNAPASFFQPWPQNFDFSKSNFIGGVNAGYNAQQNHWLYGFEVDFTRLGRGGRKDWSDVSTFGPDRSKSGVRTTTLSGEGGVDTLLTFRGRAGFVMDRWLVFGTAGPAVGHASIRTSASLIERYVNTSTPVAFDVTNIWSGGASELRLGYAVGGGVEYALTERFRLKFEGLFYDLGTLRAVANGSGFYSQNGGAAVPITVQPYSISKSLDGAIFRAGFNYGF